MKHTKKNTDENTSINTHTEKKTQRIIQKIDEVGRETYALKKKENAFYAEALKKSRRSREFLDTDKLREIALDKFEWEWKKIEEGKDEVDYLIHSLYISIEDEEEKK